MLATAALSDPPDARLRAQALVQRGQYAEAVTLLSSLIAANPRDADLQYRLGLAYQRSGHVSAAAEALSRAAQLRPNEASYAAALARLYAGIPRYDRASFWYRKLLHLRPQNPKLAAEAASFALQEKQPLDAELILKQALATHAKSAELWLLLAQTYGDLTLREEQARCLERAAQLKPLPPAQLRQLIDLHLRAGRPERALPYLQMARRQQPNDPALQARLAECYLAVKDHKSALAAYREAVRLAPRVADYRLALAQMLGETDPAASLREYDAAFPLQQLTAEQLLAAATVAARAKDPAAARRYLVALVALQPQQIEPRQMLIQAALAQGDAATAVAQWRELELAGHLQYGLDEAELALRLGGKEWARGRLEEIAGHAAGQPALQARLASLYLQLPDAPRAATLAQAALAHKPVGPEARATRLVAAQVLLQAGQPERAEPVFAEILAAEPHHAAAQRGRALCLLKRGQVRQAWEKLRTAAREHPRDPQIILALIDAAAAADELDATALLLRELLQAEPDKSAVLEGLTLLYRRQGGDALAASKLAELAGAEPHPGLVSLTTARELAAAGEVAGAAALYERLARESDYKAAARVGLCDLLLARQRYPELLAALARVSTPQAIGAEAHRLLLAANSGVAAPADPPADLGAVARAAAAVCLAQPQSEGYYVGLAEMYVGMRQAEQGLGFLQSEATRQEVAPGATVGLARLLRQNNRAREALVWLDHLGASAKSPTALLERAQALLQTQRVVDAGLVAEQALRAASPAQRTEAHQISGEACAVGYRPEEALWHFVQAFMGGGPREALTARIVGLCTNQPLDEAAVINALQQLYARGYTAEALGIAKALADKPGFGRLRGWALERAKPPAP